MGEQRFQKVYKVTGNYVGPDDWVHAWFVQHVVQEVSIAVTEHRGFTTEWYRRRGTGWVMRRFQAELARPWVLDDVVAVETWLSRKKRLSVHREYRFTEKRSGVELGGAQAEWVYVELATTRPTPLPEELERNFIFEPEEAVSAWDPELSEGAPEGTRQSRRTVRYSELDGFGHANNVIYLRWIADALFEQGPGGFWIQRWKLEFRRPARLGDEVVVTTTPCGSDQEGTVCRVEIQESESRKGLARGYVMLGRRE